MERFLHAGRFSVASIYAPISFPPLYVVAMKKAVDIDAPALAAVGSLISVDPDRIILKKIILTGYISSLYFQISLVYSLQEMVNWKQSLSFFVVTRVRLGCVHMRPSYPITIYDPFGCWF